MLKITNIMEHKIEVAKKILTLANEFDGKVFGGFVRDVIVPKLNDPNCIVSFKDVDIWFQDKGRSGIFINFLVENFTTERVSFTDRDLEYPNAKFCRRQYRIYENDKFLFHIDVITSDKLPVNDFDVNLFTYKHTEKGFESCDNSKLQLKLNIINKIATMLDNYNPEGYKHYERINRIFFEKGWTVKCDDRDSRLSNYIRTQNLKIKEQYDNNDGFYCYIPKNKLKDSILYIPSLKISGTSEQIRKTLSLNYSKQQINEYLKEAVDGTKNNKSNADINNKDIMISIFNTGLEALAGKLYNDIEDKELRQIYKCGLDEYRAKFESLLK